MFRKYFMCPNLNSQASMRRAACAHLIRKALRSRSLLFRTRSVTVWTRRIHIELTIDSDALNSC